MAASRDNPVLEKAIHERLEPLSGAADLDVMLEPLKDKRVVMLGESSHGTQEFYEWRRIISRRLIEEHDFSFIAVEGDWPDAQRIHRHCSKGEDADARKVLENFRRWPTWMWANTEIVELMDWLRRYNSSLGAREKIGFHGLDVYSLYESIDDVISYLEKQHPFLVRRARERYACFERFGRDEHRYARSLFRFPEGCEEEVLANLQDLLKLRLDPSADSEGLFDAQQNARIIRNAERYYRSMVQVDESSWNIRDRHMMDTLNLLLQRYGPDAKAIVWAHNTHIGDYRATSMLNAGLFNIGGLAREEYGSENVALVGFGTYEGSVIASHSWGGPIQQLPVPAARDGSYEGSFHRVAEARGLAGYYLCFDEEGHEGPFSDVHGHRAIGVVYDPLHEQRSNYVPTSLSNRYDIFVYFDRTRALEPLGYVSDSSEIPEAWPSGV